MKTSARNSEIGLFPSAHTSRYHSAHILISISRTIRNGGSSMRTRRVLGIFVLIAGISLGANAQASRTWVSGVGDDVNPCSRTAPCKTFAGAISKTAAGGEISALDPGGFGGFTITKSLTINGDGNLTSILVSGTNGITINAGASDVIILRSLSFNGIGGLGLNGVRLNTGAMLVVENCAIYGFGQAGIDLEPAASTSLAMKNVSITGGATGVRVNGSSGTVNASLSNVSIRGSVNGIDALFGTTDVRDSTISQSSGSGVLAEAGSVTVVNTALTGNNVGAQAQTGATVRLSNVDVFDNSTGFGCGGGILASAGNNHKGGNVGGGAACIPNAAITVQ